MLTHPRRVVITGFGLISPLGNSPDAAWQNLVEQNSSVGPLTALPESDLPVRFAAEAHEFTGTIDDFGQLEKLTKRSIKKGLKLMCREIEMGVAAAQLSLQHAGLEQGSYDPQRFGTLFGSDYIMTMPQEFAAGIWQCLEQGKFDHRKWGEQGLSKVDPLWLLKYLPNMPASHVAIYNDLRGPSNSLTMREASSNAAIAEAVTTIRRGTADMMLAGSTGTRIHPLRSVHVAMQESLAAENGSPEKASRPFDLDRSGMVLGEGAGCLVLESLESAESRCAHIYGEVVGYCASTVADANGVADYEKAFENILDGVLKNCQATPGEVGHVHAHGLSTKTCDQAEATAINRVFDGQDVPVTAAKSYMGNLGAGGGLVETIASVLALQHNTLFPVLNYETPDPECSIRIATAGDSPGDSFINANITPQGQASSVLVRKI